MSKAGSSGIGRVTSAEYRITAGQKLLHNGYRKMDGPTETGLERDGDTIWSHIARVSSTWYGKEFLELFGGALCKAVVYNIQKSLVMPVSVTALLSKTQFISEGSCV